MNSNGTNRIMLQMKINELDNIKKELIYLPLNEQNRQRIAKLRFHKKRIQKELDKLNKNMSKLWG